MANEVEGLARDQFTVRSTQALRDVETIREHLRALKREAGFGDGAPPNAEICRRALAYMAKAIRAGQMRDSNERGG